MLRRFRVAAIALALSATACGKQQPRPQPEPGSDVRQEAHETGETWRASTRLRDTSRQRAAWVTVDEEVRFDAAGRLVFAETRARDDAGTPEVHVTFDPPAHKVVVERAGRHVEWKVPGEQPWIIAPVMSPTGEPIATPLVAWITYRAAENNDWVRLVRPLEQKSYVVPRDQYVVGTTVVVGDDAVEVDDRFVRAISLGGAPFARATHAGGFLFRGG